MEYFFGWIIFSFVVGFVGSSRKIGFWRAFFLSLLLSPIIGLIIALVSKNIADEEYKEQILKAQQKQQVALSRMIESKPVENTNFSIIEELGKLKKLKDSNVITEEEFISLKKKVIASNDNIENSIQKKPIKNYARLEKLTTGEALQFVNEINSLKNPEVRINDNFPSNGIYKLYNRTVAFKISDGKITDNYFIESYKQNDGRVIKIGGLSKGINGVRKGCPVWINNKLAPKRNYKIKIGSINSITVVNGVVESFGF